MVEDRVDAVVIEVVDDCPCRPFWVESGNMIEREGRKRTVHVLLQVVRRRLGLQQSWQVRYVYLLEMRFQYRKLLGTNRHQLGLLRGCRRRVSPLFRQ